MHFGRNCRSPHTVRSRDGMLAGRVRNLSAAALGARWAGLLGRACSRSADADSVRGIHCYAPVCDLFLREASFLRSSEARGPPRIDRLLPV
jgi:hypothetical protein